MDVVKSKTQLPSEGERAAEQSKVEAATAQAHDLKDEPRHEPENLTLVDYKGLIIEHSSDPTQLLTPAQLDRMTAPEIRAVGHDRGYWRRGVSLATKAQIIEKFLEKQEELGLSGKAALRDPADGGAAGSESSSSLDSSAGASGS